LAHITCINSSKEQVLSVLREFRQNGIENVLALRGDRIPDAPEQGDFSYARDLVHFVHGNCDFDIAGACYPEGHPECDSLAEDITHLREKVDMGITHLNSQLFFDNEDFYRFIELVRRAGITVPVQAGIMPVTNARQIERMVSLTGAKLPGKFSRIIARYGHSPQALRDAGIAYATEQIIDLVASGVDGIHLYTMNQPYIARQISGNIASLLSDDNEGGQKIS
ncbi:MAG: methylenetetrahydrofolate reductase, partial [Acetanaerobacterium sp.]